MKKSAKKTKTAATVETTGGRVGARSMAKNAAGKGISPDSPKRATSKKPKSKPNGSSQFRPGRPLGSADVWTPEFIAKVAAELEKYIAKTDCPMVAEICFNLGIRRQRLYEHPELESLVNMLQAKRAIYYEKAGRRLTKEQGPRGAFIMRQMANLGDYSVTEKTEVEHSGSVTTPTLELVLQTGVAATVQEAKP